jgi:hypothetical protein
MGKFIDTLLRHASVAMTVDPFTSRSAPGHVHEARARRHKLVGRARSLAGGGLSFLEKGYSKFR